MNARLVCVLGACGLLILAGQTTAPAGTSPPEVEVSPPVAREVTDAEDFTGRIEPVSTVDIRARVNGYVEKVGFKEGAEVKQGDLLFQIDPRPYQAELAKAQAEVARAEGRLQRAAAALERAGKQKAANAISQEEFERARGERDDAEAELRVARAALELRRLNLEYTRVMAPISGRIGRHRVDPGDLVRADETILAQLVSQDLIDVSFDVDEKTVLRQRRLAQEGKVKSAIQAAMPVLMGLADEKGYPHQGKVDFVDNQFDPATGTLRVRAVFPNPDGMLLPGMFARVRLPLVGPRKALLVPERAIGTDQGQKFVYVVNDSNAVVFRPVTVGGIHCDLQVVEEGLQPGERVIINGMARVRPGDKVRPHQTSPPANP